MTETSIVLPDVVVDRSPELARARYAAPAPGSYSVEVMITAEDITEAKRGDGSACALARVIKRICPPGTAVNISGEHPTINGRELRVAPELVEWIGRFDRGEPVDPVNIEFTGENV